MPNFYHLSGKEEFLQFMRDGFGATPDDYPQLTFYSQEIAVHFADPKRRRTPSVALLKSASPEARKAYAAMKKRFSKPEKLVFLVVLGREFYSEYYQESPTRALELEAESFK